VNPRYLDIWVRACEHIERSFVDREFVAGPWPGLRDTAEARIRDCADDSAFHREMSEVIEGLPATHSRFLTPDTVAYVRRRTSAEGIPSMLQAEHRQWKDVLYVRAPSFAIPPFSLEPWIALLRGASGSETLVVDLRLCTGGSSSAVGEVLGFLLGPDRPYLRSRHVDADPGAVPEVLRPIPSAENLGHAREVEALTSHAHAEWRTKVAPESSFAGPVVVLIGPRTYSCGELFAKVIQEASRGLLVGRPTAGALVGARDDFDCGYGYRLLLPFVWLDPPSGDRVDGHPVLPDVPLDIAATDEVALALAEVSAILGHLRAREDARNQKRVSGHGAPKPP
jgi:C-terminal processing protease CtpA/Prc